MGDVEGKKVWLSAVDKGGEDVIVENDFSIHVEHENYYMIYKKAEDNEPVFIIKQPSLDIEEYNPNGIEEVFFPEMGLYPGTSGLFQFIIIGDTKVKNNKYEIDMNISSFMENLSKKSGDSSTAMWSLFAVQYDMNHLLEFDEKNVVICDDPNLKVGYFTTNRFGKTNYNIVIITCKQIYYAKNCKFWDDIDDDQIDNNEDFLDRLLTSVKIVKNDKKEKKESSPDNKLVRQNSLNNNKNRIVENNKKIKEIEKDIFDIKEKIKTDEAIIREFEDTIYNEKNTFENIDKQFKDEIKDYELKTNRIIEEKKEKESALHILTKEEQRMRMEADKSILLKEKKFEEVDLLFNQIKLIKEKTKQLGIDIDNNTQIIGERQKKYDQDKKKRALLIKSIELYISELKSRIQDNNFKLKVLENRKKILCK